MQRYLNFIIPVLAAGFLYTALAASVPAQGILQDILKRMDDQNKSLTSLRASVTMVKQNAQLGDSDTTQGTAIYLPQKGRDALVRIDWVKPDESLAVVNKEYVIYRPRLKQAYTGSTEKAKGNGKAAGAFAFMSMSRAQLKANYDVKYIGEETVSSGVKTWHLQLSPKTKSNYTSAEIWIDANGFPVQSKVNEVSGDATTILLSNLEKNISIDGGKFKIVLPKGTSIIKS
ncbi:MAG: outer membrane lipoprotein carrier protein LolA [Acidobacteriota bacterium]